ncbi:hypothetical protein FGB62_51g121 [Gracilaria domingensis]|nr:hypothetical protein FGB62_51g121 [Gracilaria domingensis]
MINDPPPVPKAILRRVSEENRTRKPAVKPVPVPNYEAYRPVRTCHMGSTKPLERPIPPLPLQRAKAIAGNNFYHRQRPFRSELENQTERFLTQIAYSKSQ